METEEIKVCQREYRLTSIDVHPLEKALIVKFDLDAAIQGQLGRLVLEESRNLQKIIRIKNLSDDTDINILASDIIEKSGVIPETKHHEVEQLLFYLQMKNYDLLSVGKDHGEDVKPNASVSEMMKPVDNEEVANISSLDNYIELLYENTSEKVKSSAMVLQLARKSDNLTILAKNDILLGALARVLREDGKKSLDLCINIIYTFFCFSAFRQFHHIVAQHKIGSLCMEAIDSELKRYRQLYEDLCKKHSEIDNEPKNVYKYEYDVFRQKFSSIVKKQDQLLRVSVYLLYNISEDTKLEVKMVNRGIVSMLAKCLERDHHELQLLSVSFLKKLSTYIENRDELVRNNVVEELAKIIPHEHDSVLNVALRLLWNLSFDIELRNAIVRHALIPKFVKLLSSEQYRSIVLGILYHISMEDRYKPLLTYIECIPIVIKFILDWPEKVLPINLISFAINLAGNKRNAQLMCDGDNLILLISRALRYCDSLLMKMIRNISQHEGTKDEFVGHVNHICAAITTGNPSDDLVLECLGTLGNLSIPQIDFEKIFIQYDLLKFMVTKLSEEGTEDDMILEVIIVAGAAAGDESCAAMILECGMLNYIIEFLNAKQEDDEIVLQIIFLFYRLIYHQGTRDTIIKETNVPAYLTDLMHDKNPEIRKYCDAALELVSASNKEWAKKIQIEKFRWHNCQWLEMIESQQIEETDYYLEDSYTPCIQESDILNRSDLLYGSGAYESLLSDASISPDDVLEGLPAGVPNEVSSCRPKSRYKNRNLMEEE